MKVTIIFALFCGCAASASPISKIIQLISDLQAKIVKEGTEEQKVYEQFAEFCEDRSKDLQFDIKTAKAEKAELEATIAKEDSNAEALNAKIEKLAASIAADDEELKEATEIREKENTDFIAEEKELMDVIDMLQRAISVLEKEMGKAGSTAMLQLKDATSVTQALEVLVQASAISSQDGSKLTALLQANQQSDDSQEPGAPAAAVYEGHAGDIISTLESLLEKAETQLADARRKETAAQNSFDMLKQSLTDDMKFANKDMDEAKKSLAESGEKKAAAQGDLKVTNDDLKVDTTALADLHQDCMNKAQDYEAATKSRTEEVAAITKAKQVLVETTGGAEGQVYVQTSLLQVARSKLSSREDLAHFEAGRLIRDMARKQNSPALAQLASRVTAALRAGSGEDVFAKVKGLISDMIEKLENEADEDATHKAYCDKNLAEANAKKADKNAEIEKLTAQIEQMKARSAKLKEEVAALQKSLAELAAAQADMDKIRAEEKATFTQVKSDLDKGLDGVKLALKTLRDYYDNASGDHKEASGAGAGIIGLLEVVESDLTKSLTEAVSTEETAVATYEQETKENAVEKTSKEQDVKYKSKEAADLDKAVAEASADRNGVQEELDAVLETLKALNEQCIEKAETYAERKARREAEINGLKQAMQILESETAFIQSGSHHVLRLRKVQ